MICLQYTPNRPVAQVQMWLRALARREGADSLPAVDGIYSENTACAVRRFQAAHGLPVTGVVDFATWTALSAAYAPVGVCEGLPGPLYVDCHDPKIGTAGSNIFILQAILNTLSPHFGNLPPIAYTGEFDTATQEHVNCIQEASGLPPGGVVDRLTWNALASLYNANQSRVPIDWLRSE